MANAMTTEEKAMMADLLAGLDDSLSDYNPTPVKKEITTSFTLSPCASRSKSARKEMPSPLGILDTKQEAFISPVKAKPVKKTTVLSPLRTKHTSYEGNYSTPSPRKVKRPKVSPSPLSKSKLWKDAKQKGKENQPTIPRGLKAKKKLDALVEGMGDSDWDDMEAEASKVKMEVEAILTPVSHCVPWHCDWRYDVDLDVFRLIRHACLLESPTSPR